MFQTDINYVATLVAAIVSYVIGAVWYSAIGFQKPWMKLAGLNGKDAKVSSSMMGKTYAIGFVTILIATFVLARLLVWTRAADLVSALKIGGWLWLGFVAVWMLNDWLYEKKPAKLIVIKAGYALVVILVSSAILILWK